LFPAPCLTKYTVGCSARLSFVKVYLSVLVCLQMQEPTAFVVLLIVYCSDEAFRLLYYK